MENTNNTNSIAKFNVGAIMVLPKIILALLAIIIVVAVMRSFWWGLLSVVVTIVFIVVSLRNIPNRPPHVGIVTVWGKKLPIIKSEGWHFFLPFLPFMYTVTTVNVKKVNLDFIFEDIRCIAKKEKSQEEADISRWAGGEISVKISLTYFPDYKTKESARRLISFINSGEQEGVKEIIRDLLEEDIRQMAGESTWEEITFAADEIKKALVMKITGQQLTEQLAEELGRNGLPDIADLGVKVTRFNVGRVKEQGGLAEAAGKLAIERQEKRGELMELTTIYEMLKKFKRLGVPVTEALDAIQTERKKAEKKIFAIRGAEGVAPAIIAGLGVLGNVVGEKEKKGSDKKKKEKKQKNNK